VAVLLQIIKIVPLFSMKDEGPRARDVLAEYLFGKTISLVECVRNFMVCFCYFISVTLVDRSGTVM